MIRHESPVQNFSSRQTIFSIQDKQWESALYYTKLLEKLVPGVERPKHMQKQIQQAMKTEKDTVE